MFCVKGMPGSFNVVVGVKGMSGSTNVPAIKDEGCVRVCQCSNRLKVKGMSGSANVSIG